MQCSGVVSGFIMLGLDGHVGADYYFHMSEHFIQYQEF